MASNPGINSLEKLPGNSNEQLRLRINLKNETQHHIHYVIINDSSSIGGQ